MPLIKFRCPACGREEKRFKDFKTDPQECSNCGCLMDRVIGAPPVHYSSGGFTKKVRKE